jgi:cell filamentation protein
VFDPFGDYETAGYLRNHSGEKDLEIVKAAEHHLFKAQLPTAQKYLERRQRIEYPDFLKIHEILFSGLYPWAGQDRASTLAGAAVIKGQVVFAHPQECRLGVEYGLRLAQGGTFSGATAGQVMGLFAYAHPFLDGNGRTMLVVHAELSFRGGFSVDWANTRKSEYLQVLTQEIEEPDKGHLDHYLAQFIRPQVSREAWGAAFTDLAGLDGLDAEMNKSAEYSNAETARLSKEFERKRAYKIPT